MASYHYISKDFCFFLAISLVITIDTFSQERCGTVDFIRHLRNAHQVPENDAQFEEWLALKKSTQARRTMASQDMLEIPVVVHVIHKGETEGLGSNISEAQILSQLKVLNSDFNRNNSDTVNTPASFKSVASSINIRFVMARKAPGGEPTKAILRVKGSKNTWSVNDDATLKAISYWPAEDYLNIWVADLSDALMGYAQFPSSTLPGLDGTSVNRLKDGVVVDYMAFGSADDGEFNLYTDFNKGRAATHEIGHFLGLRHIWGDDDNRCGGNGDYVSDTPDQTGSTNGCPAHPYVTCSSPSMFQNYMDYSNDDCMNIFTVGQVDRMETVLSNSPRRASLVTSPALIFPARLENDIGIEAIISPQIIACDSIITPQIRVKNNGTNPVHTAKVRIMGNDQELKTQTFYFDPAITASTISEITFDPLVCATGTLNFTFEVIATNDVDDTNFADNEESVIVDILYETALPVKERFDILPSNWLIQNPDANLAWALKDAPSDDPSNTSLYLKFYLENIVLDETSILLTPPFNLAEGDSPFLIFDVAYAASSRNDALKIYLSPACSPHDTGTEIYSKSGSALATVQDFRGAFVPAGKEHWRREVIDLRDFVDKGGIQLAFAGINDGGNNLFIDNIQIVSALFDNIAIKKITNPSPVLCGEEVQPSLIIENAGKTSINSFCVRYSINNGEIKVACYSEGVSLAPDSLKEILLPSVQLNTGENLITFKVVEPNDLADIFSEGDSSTMRIIVDKSMARIPLRENFDGDSSFAWTAVSPLSDAGWKNAETSFNVSQYVNSYDQSKQFGEAWLVSPVLDFSGVFKASLFFDFSYRNRTDGNDRLRILASRDCGITYDEVLLDRGGPALSSASQDTPWKPSMFTDWQKEYINLNSLVGQDEVRLAFIFTNGNGNNFYLDNLEFFTSDDPAPVSVQSPYSLYGNLPGSTDFLLTFNLEKKGSVKYELIDVAGRRIGQGQWDEVLNQTFLLNCQEISGLYIFRLAIGGQVYTERIVIGQ